MCGIAGYSLDADSDVDRTLAAQALLAGIAERGADAVGYAHRGARRGVTIHKQRSGATALLDAIELPPTRRDALVHVRDYTKGHPTVLANNHPIRHGSVVGIHNGIIVNDEEIFARHRFERAEPEMTVDSEAIFALMELTGSDHAALEQLRGSMATAWIDERVPGRIYLARGVARPLWIGRSRRELFFASTKSALEVVEGTLRLTLRKQEVSEGRLLHLERGQIVTETPLPARSLAIGTTGTLPSGARTARGRLVPREARRARRVRRPSSPIRVGEPSGRHASPDRLTGSERAVGPDADAFLAQPLADEELERGPRPDVDVDEPVDLPLRQQRRIRAAGLLPVGHLRQPAEPAGQHRSLRDRALELLVADRDVEPCLAERRAERSERVPDQRLRRHPAAVRVEVARRRRPTELGAELPQLLEELVAADEAPRRQARRALGGIPRAEVLDHGLRVHARLRIGRELPHRRRAAEPLGARAQLLEDLLVGVAPSDACAKLSERCLVDPGEGRVATTGPGHMQLL